MDKNVKNIINKLEAKRVEVAKEVNKSNDVNKSLNQLESHFKNSEEQFKAETGRPMTYSEMRAMFG